MWTPLSEIPLHETLRFGHKAVRLTEAQARGLPVPPSFVLDASSFAAIGRELTLAEALASELCERLPEVERVLLRSSSPLEDRRDSSAAGLLPTVSRALRVDAIAEGLREMAVHMDREDLRELLGVENGAIPLAVLAQPQLELELWCTLEWNPLTGTARIEGRQLDSCGDHPLQYEAIPLEEHDTLSESGVGLGALMELARRAQEGSQGIWLLELGIVDGEGVLLQRRPVAYAAPRADGLLAGVASSENAAALEAATGDRSVKFMDFPTFEVDEVADWEWDAAHSPRPLAPLLASVFVEWIRERGVEHPSRLIDGRWHDRRIRDDASREAPQMVPPSLEDATRELREALQYWNTERGPALERGLELVEMLAADCGELASWRLFLVAWLDWQGKYYDGAAGRMRRLAASCLGENATPALPETIARRREMELDRLAAQWKHWDAAMREEELAVFLEDHGHHAPGGWDGYGVPWDEDPTPLLQELERRAASEGNAGPEAQAVAPSLDAASPAVGDQDPEQLAAAALAALEDDDDLLAYAYALFRDAALNLEEEIQPHAEEGEILDILESDLAALERAPSNEAWREARARGARLRARWEKAMPGPLPPANEGELLHGHPRLCEGQAEGRPRILDTALRDGGPEAGEILVVPTILPGDAIVFARCAGLICESGEVLGHAAVLAREKQVPALVLPQACSRLQGAQRIYLDAAAGVVRILSEDSSA